MDVPAIAPADVLTLSHLVEACLSPDGEQAAYIVAATATDTMTDYTCLWIADVDTAQARRLTQPGDVVTGPSWSPDGDRIAYRSHASGTPQIHVIDVAGGSTRQMTSATPGVAATGPFWSPSGEHIAYTAPVKPPRDSSRPYRVTRQFWRLDGAGLIDDVTHELFLIGVDGGEPRQLTEEDGLIMSAQWSAKGDRLLYVAFVEHDTPRCVVRSCDAMGGDVRTHYEEDNYGFWPTVAWLPDGRIVRSTTNLVAKGMPPVAIVIDGGVAEPELRSGPVDGWIYGLVVGDLPLAPFVTPRLLVSPDGESAYVPVQRGGSRHVWEIALTGKPSARPLEKSDSVSVAFDVRMGRVLVGTMSMHEPPDLAVVDLAGGEKRRLGRLNGNAFRAGERFEIEPLAFGDADGAALEGWFLRPRHARGPVPTIVQCHGGPHAAWGHAFSFDNEFLLAAGYGVLLVNQRGSTGYDREFATDLHGDWGHHDVGDILAGLDLVVDRGLADPERLGIFGISAGAFLAAWITAHDHRFRAGIVESPAISWTAMSGGDVGHHYWRWLGGKNGLGVEAAEPYVRFSPTTYAGACKTPMLIIQHEGDLRTPPATSEEYYSLLRMHGCTTEMLRMPVTPHSGSLELGSPITRVAQNEAVLEWLNRFVLA
ncbi:prolyl oligopeptidase family serine peptidase [Nonomuraea sp. NBC_00507]|uniref:S9 family peptidase n=1 Tax=Nonomuraea sp. NBC_00507 TaxID=2976002 RepID=UPI002E18F2E6